MGNTLLFCDCDTQETQLVRPDCYTQDNLGGQNGYKIRYKGSRASQIGKGSYPVSSTDNSTYGGQQLQNSGVKPSYDVQIQLKSSTSNKESNGILSLKTKSSLWNIGKGYDSSSRKNQKSEALKQKWTQFHIEENDDSEDEESKNSFENTAALPIRRRVRTVDIKFDQAERLKQQLQNSSFNSDISGEDEPQKFTNAEEFAVEREKLKMMNQHRLFQIYYKPICQDEKTSVEKVMLSGLKAELEAEDLILENTAEWSDSSLENCLALDKLEFNMSLIELDEYGETIDEVFGNKSDNLIENFVHSLSHSDTSHHKSEPSPLKSLDSSFLDL